MMTIKRFAATVALFSLAGGSAGADDSNWGVGLKAGTLGLGAEARWSGLPWMDVRIGGNAYTFDDSGRYDGVRYDAELQLENYFVTANFHFPLSPFRFTVGAYQNGNEVFLTGDEPASYDFGGPTDWTPEQIGNLYGEAVFAGTSPYVGLGYDFELFGKVGLNFDLGLLYQGEAEITLASSGGSVQNDPVLGPLLAAELAAESERLEDDFSNYKAYPVVALSFVYNF